MRSQSSEDVLNRALSWATQNHTQASIQKRSAFANSVHYLVTGWSGGYGGPSVREHAVSWAATQVPAKDPLGPGRFSFAEACRFADPLVFGPLTDLHRQCWDDEHCFDDDPLDEAALQAFGALN